MLTHSPVWLIPGLLRSSARIRDANSPNRAELRTFRLAFSLQHPKARQRLRTKGKGCYRNPIALAREWQAALESGQCASRANLARDLGVSRARVSQVLKLLRLCPEISDKIAALGDPMPGAVLTERKLRSIADLPPVRQKRWVKIGMQSSP